MRDEQLENLLDTLESYFDSKRILSAAEAECDYDRDYFLARQYRAVDDARASFKMALRDVITSVMS